jgi:hypothetical protein
MTTLEHQSRVDQVARFGGIVFVLLAVGGFFGAGDAGFDDGAKIAAYFADHRTRILICFHIAAIGMLAFVAWAWWLMRTIERLDSTRDGLGLAVFIAGAMTVAVEFGVIALAMTLAVISNQPVDPQIARAFANAYQTLSCVDYFPLALFFLAFGIAALRTGIVRPWLSWSAIALVPLVLIAAAPALGLDAPVGLLTFLWVVAANIAVLRSPRTRSGAERRDSAREAPA